MYLEDAQSGDLFETRGGFRATVVRVTEGAVLVRREGDDRDCQFTTGFGETVRFHKPARAVRWARRTEGRVVR